MEQINEKYQVIEQHGNVYSDVINIISSCKDKDIAFIYQFAFWNLVVKWLL